MNKIFHLIIIVISLNVAATASIFSSFSRNKSEPENKNSSSAILLWIPSKNTPLNDVLDEIERNPGLKINIALSKSTDTLTMQKLKKLSEEGRIETVMRLENNPVIGLFYYPKDISVYKRDSNNSKRNNNPFFFAQRFTDGRQVFMEEIKHIPEGFANTPGDIFPDYIPLAKSISLNWIASGPLISTSSYETFNCEGVNIVPFELLKSSSNFTFKKAGLQFIVYDETISTKTTLSPSKLFLNFLEKNKEKQYLTVKEALRLAISTSISRNHLEHLTVPWSEYSLWSSNRDQNGLLNGLGKVREEILRFMGLNPKNGKKAKSILNDFYSIESSEQLLSFRTKNSKESRKVELDLQKKLARIYRKMNKNLPSWIFKSFKELSPSNSDAEVIVSSGTNFISLKNAFFETQKTAANSESELKSSATIRLAEMKIQWTEKEIEFYLTPETINADTEKESGIDNIAIDIYIDINHRFRAGRTKAIKGKKINISPKDAWEYAISVNAVETVLNYATMSGVKQLSSVETIKENGIFKIVLQRNLLRGNPFRWGYLAILFSNNNTEDFTDKLSSNSKKGYISSIRPGKK